MDRVSLAILAAVLVCVFACMTVLVIHNDVPGSAITTLASTVVGGVLGIIVQPRKVLP